MTDAAKNGVAHKIIMVGPGNVGKSALTLQFMYDEFIEDYEPTKADSYRKKLEINGQEVTADIMDTAGQESYMSIIDSYLRSGEGFMMVFSLTEVDTLNQLDDFRERVLRVKGGGSGDSNASPPMLLVGNKSDLVDNRQVQDEAITRKADDWGIPWIITSAKTKENVDEAYTQLLQLVRKTKSSIDQQHKPGKKSKKKKEGKKKCVIL